MIPSTRLTLLERLDEPAERERKWREFYELYYPVIFRWCRNRTDDQNRAEDLTSEVFVVLLQKLPEHQHDPDRGRFRQWLKAVVNNTVNDCFRRPQLEIDGVDVETVSREQVRNQWISEDDREELVERLRECAEAQQGFAAADAVKAQVLPTTWRAWEEVEIYGRAPRDVAEELKLPVHTVYKYVSRINERLQKAITSA